MLSQHTAKHWLSVITPSLCLHGCDAAPLHLRCTRWAELKCHQDTWFFRDWNGANTKLPKLVGTQFIHVYADPSMLSAPPHSPVSRLRRTFYFYLLLFLISQRNSKKPALHWLPIVCACVCVCMPPGSSPATRAALRWQRKTVCAISPRLSLAASPDKNTRIFIYTPESMSGHPSTINTHMHAFYKHTHIRI